MLQTRRLTLTLRPTCIVNAETNSCGIVRYPCDSTAFLISKSSTRRNVTIGITALAAAATATVLLMLSATITTTTIS